MDLNQKTTDELIEIIIQRIGLPLPKYDYNDYRKFVAVYPKNIPMGDGVTGIEEADMFTTFKEACISIIQWAIEDEDVNLKL